MGELGRRWTGGGFRRRALVVLAMALVSLVHSQSPGSANHLFPLFPGDPLGDCMPALEAAPAESDASVIVGLRFVDTETLSSTTRVDVGETVTWQWVDNFCHSITSTGGPVPFTTWGGETEFGFEPQLVRPEGDARTFSVTFDQPGIYPYVCVHHQTLGVVGEVVVGDGEALPLPGRSGDAYGRGGERGNPDRELGRSEEAPGHDK